MEDACPAEPRISPAESELGELERETRQLERRDWVLWATAVAVILLLMTAVIFLSFPAFFEPGDSSSKLNLRESIRGLAGMVFLFSFHALYQQIQIKRLRRDLGHRARAAVLLRREAEQYQKLAVVDPLTGLYNRRLADSRLHEEVVRATRHRRPFCLCLFDLNDFKMINDSHGHSVGDEVLKEFARRLKLAIRSSDVVARLGGDEFIVLLPECGTDNVREVVARLRGLEVSVGEQKIPFACSAGWAEFGPGDSPQTLIERADRLLYQNKRLQKRAEGSPGALLAWKGTGTERLS